MTIEGKGGRQLPDREGVTPKGKKGFFNGKKKMTSSWHIEEDKHIARKAEAPEKTKDERH